ncbi:MAG: DUF4363 family protein [Corallococcus sp.]|nr:DUF4363 family protein [Corallococcus sp.]MCM1359419.1 DUF4363 family protein [Corallococcus sp.]MCM1394862.1 DUF4363 family protein [Corallococcus sp.]
MTKTIITGLVVLLVIITCGVLEVVFISKDYNRLHDQCVEMMDMAEKEQLTEKQFEDFRKEWEDLRETSEIFLPHIDVYELNLRFAEAESYVKQQDYDALHAQLSIIEELLDYVPHLMKPSWKHIV